MRLIGTCIDKNALEDPRDYLANDLKGSSVSALIERVGAWSWPDFHLTDHDDFVGVLNIEDGACEALARDGLHFRHVCHVAEAEAWVVFSL